MRIDHWRRYAELCRTVLCAGVGAAVLGGFPLTASAINKAGMSSYRYSISDSGKVASIRPNQSGVSGSMGSVGSVPAGQVGSQIGNTGWYVGASGSGNPSGRGTMHMGHSGDVFFAGVKYPFQAGYEVPKSAVVDALGMLCKNPLVCLGLAAASPAINGWLDKGGVRISPDQSDPSKPFQIKGTKSVKGCETPEGDAAQIIAIAQADPDGKYFGCLGVKVAIVIEGITRHGDECRVNFSCANGGGQGSYRSWGAKESTYEDWLPASMDDIAPYMDTPDVPAQAVSDILDKGGEINLPSTPTVTGPSQVQGPKQETNNADGSRTTTQTTNNYRTDGNKITNTSTTTTTNKCVGDGACSPVTTTTTTNPEEKPDDKEDGDDCKKNPDSLACAELDTPSGEIPKATRNVTLQDQELFGGGACPADRYSSVHGQQVLVWDWQQSCSYISTYMRPVLLLLCAIGAYLIVAGGLKQ